jgi:hypothetical protein
MPRRRPYFESGAAGAEAAKLKKFSDAGGLKRRGCPTRAETDCSGCFRISHYEPIELKLILHYNSAVNNNKTKGNIMSASAVASSYFPTFDREAFEKSKVTTDKRTPVYRERSYHEEEQNLALEKKDKKQSIFNNFFAKDRFATVNQPSYSISQ